jgi:hypothetical protein
MRRTACLIVLLAAAAVLRVAPAHAQAHAQTGAAPHAWLFGAWTGGLFPPPSTLSAQECLATPVVVFTRDIVMRAVVTDQFYIQRLVETARATGEGVEFRFLQSPVTASSGPFNLSPAGSRDVGFGCISPDILRVQRRTDNEISFPGCSDFAYPLVRCPAR